MASLLPFPSKVPSVVASGKGPQVRAALLETRAVYRQADAAYASSSCPASGECCQLARTGREPWLWESEWRVLEDALAREGRERPGARTDGACPFLDGSGKRCSVYADRPLGCRTFFCGRRVGPPREPMEEMDRLSRRLEHIARKLAGEAEPSEPKPLTAWLTSP